MIAVPCHLSQLSVDGQKHHLREFILVRCNGQGKQQVESRLLTVTEKRENVLKMTSRSMASSNGVCIPVGLGLFLL